MTYIPSANSDCFDIKGIARGDGGVMSGDSNNVGFENDDVVDIGVWGWVEREGGILAKL